MSAVRLRKIVSGCQSGADQAALRAARAVGLATGGWMPRRCLTEAGPRPDLAELFGLQETPTADYVERTRANVRDSDGTLWLGPGGSPGYRATIGAANANGRTWMVGIKIEAEWSRHRGPLHRRDLIAPTVPILARSAGAWSCSVSWMRRADGE